MEIIGKFRFEGHILDVYDSWKDPLFLAVEVARMIDYSVGHTSHMLECVDNHEKILVSTRNNSATARGNSSKKWFLTEFGLYEVLMQSRKPIARPLKIHLKNYLKKMRLNYDNINIWYDHIGLQAEYEDYCIFMEDFHAYVMTYEEFIENRLRNGPKPIEYYI